MVMGIRVLPEELRTIDSATFTGSYQALGDPTEFPGVLVKFVNDTTVDVIISWDGVTDHDIVTAGGFALYDITSNEKTSDGFFIAIGTQFWVKGIAGVGNFYAVLLHASEV